MTDTTIPFAEIRSWMFEKALPFWGGPGMDPRGGPHESLDLDGVPTQTDFKRARVICRQIYVFCHAFELGWAPGAALAKNCFSRLRFGWLGADGGWARTLTPDGAVKDATPDLYDIAFALFALSWLHRATGNAQALALAEQTVDFLEAKMRHPGGAGFLHESPPNGWRLQNPHMHLVEAALAAYEASQRPRFVELARSLADLFRTKFFDAPSGTLAEYFDEDWRRAPGEPGRITEPGHQFEWAWILTRAGALIGEDYSETALRLVETAEARGVSVEGVTYNQVRDDGVALDRGSRTWPNTERIKAHLAVFELTGADPRATVAQSARLLLQRYLAHAPAGTWIDAFDEKGTALSRTIPTSTFYHVFLAFAEILRLEPRLNAL